MNRLAAGKEETPTIGNEAEPPQSMSGSITQSAGSPKIQVIWEQEDSADAANRLLKAFEMLLVDLPLQVFQPPVQASHFDKNQTGVNHDGRGASGQE